MLLSQEQLARLAKRLTSYVSDMMARTIACINRIFNPAKQPANSVEEDVKRVFETPEDMAERFEEDACHDAKQIEDRLIQKRENA